MTRERGFTLVELAIVLVIIGIMLAGVLKGQQMIENAKLKKLKQDLDGFSAAIYTYYDRYSYFPGDDPNASSHWSGATNGDGDGRINDGSQEAEAWDHMRRAGLIAGSGTTLPSGPFGNYTLNCYRDFGSGSQNCIQASNVPASVGEDLDTKYDDGVYDAGSIQASDAYTETINIYWRL